MKLQRQERCGERKSQTLNITNNSIWFIISVYDVQSPFIFLLTGSSSSFAGIVLLSILGIVCLFACYDLASVLLNKSAEIKPILCFLLVYPDPPGIKKGSTWSDWSAQIIFSIVIFFFFFAGQSLLFRNSNNLKLIQSSPSKWKSSYVHTKERAGGGEGFFFCNLCLAASVLLLDN